MSEEISIHALRVEGDRRVWDCVAVHREISIHALRVEGDMHGCNYISPGTKNFYPRPPGGGRQVGRLDAQLAVKISIHALRVEGDSKAPEFCIRIIISIHALRVEGDSKNGQSFRLFLRKREKNLPL